MPALEFLLHGPEAMPVVARDAEFEMAAPRFRALDSSERRIGSALCGTVELGARVVVAMEFGGTCGAIARPAALETVPAFAGVGGILLSCVLFGKPPSPAASVGEGERFPLVMGMVIR